MFPFEDLIISKIEKMKLLTILYFYIKVSVAFEKKSEQTLDIFAMKHPVYVCIKFLLFFLNIS